MKTLPANWDLASIEDSVEAIIDYRGKTPPKTDLGIPLITAKIIENGRISEPFEFISEEIYESWMRRGFPQKGDILITTEAPLGEVAQLEEEKVALAQRIILLRGCSNKLENNYLKWVLQSPYIQRQLITRSTGSTVVGIKQKELRKVQLPLPPLEEQRRIAAILDKADGVRRKRKEAIALTEELLRSVFLDMFGDPVTNPKGWEIKPLGEIAQFVGGGTPSRKVSEYFEGNICWATSKDMGVDVLSDTQEHITEEAIEKSATKLVQAGCLLVVVKSKVLMHRLPVAKTIVPVCFGQDLKAIVPVDVSMTRYLHRHLRFGQEILLRKARGVNTEGLTLRVF